jgi:Ca-activated chloride channel family protein
VVIATDGYVSVETEAFDLIRNNLNQANMFTFGIGKSVNRFLLEGMARVGSGELFVITDQKNAPARAEKFREYIQSPVLTGIACDFEEFEVYDVEPLSVPDVLAERPVILFGKWRGKPEGKITLSGYSGEGIYRRIVDVNEVSPLAQNSALRYLWARKRIEVLGDYHKLRSNDSRKEEITKLGLSYNLLTAYTSFVAIDEEIRRKDTNLKTVKQPLPMPQGVSKFAIRKVPEPELSFLMIAAAILIILTLRTKP